MTILGFEFVNAILDDGSVFVARGNCILFHTYLPDWAITAYTRRKGAK